jgi:hypothetical protein
MPDPATRKRINRMVLAGKAAERREDAPLAVDRARSLRSQLRVTRLICGTELIVAALALVIALLVGSVVIGAIAGVSVAILGSALAIEALLRPRALRAEKFNSALLDETERAKPRPAHADSQSAPGRHVKYAVAAIVIAVLLTGQRHLAARDRSHGRPRAARRRHSHITCISPAAAPSSDEPRARLVIGSARA